MSSLRRSAAVSLIALVALTGCSRPAPPEPPPLSTQPPLGVVTPPTPTPTPSREDIAGRRAGEFYLMIKRIASDPQVPITDINEVAKGAAAEAQSKFFTQMRGRGERMIGPMPRVYQVEFGVPTEGDEGRERIPVSLCLDIRGIDRVDASGKSVNAPGRPESLAKNLWLEKWPDDWYVMGTEDGSHSC